ncbi:MAG: hypothetical protein WKF57_18855 [Nakamurella sp.]
MSADDIEAVRRELAMLKAEVRALRSGLYRLIAALLTALLAVGQLTPISRFSLTVDGPIESFSLFWLAPRAITGGGSTSAADWLGYLGFIGLTVVTLLTAVGLFVLLGRRAVGDRTRPTWIGVVGTLLVIGTVVGILLALAGGTAIWPAVAIDALAVVLTAATIFARPDRAS